MIPPTSSGRTTEETPAAPEPDRTEAFRQGEEKYRVVLDHLPDLVLVHRDGIIYYVNPAMVDILGIRPDEALRRPFLDYVPPEFHSRITEAIRRRRESGRDQPYEIEIVPRAGEPRAVLVRGSMIEFDGAPAVLNVLTDITERKRAERALHESEQRNAAMIAAIPDLLFVLSPDGTYLDFQAADQNLLAISPDQILGKNISDAGFAPDIAEAILQAVSAAIQTGTLQRVEYKLAVPAGLSWFEARIVRRGTDQALAVVRDISERRRAEEALRESEGRMHTLLETIPDLIWLKDKEGVYLSCNTMFERFFGAGEAVIAGKTDYDFVDRSLADSFRENDRRAMAAGGPSINEEWITFADDGHRALLETIKTPMYDAGGALIGVLGIGRDITDRKQIEEALRESRQLFSDIISFLPDATMVIDLEGKVLAWNRALEQLSGIPAAGMIGKENHEYSIWQYGERRPILIDLVLHPDQGYGKTGYTDIVQEGPAVTAQTKLTRPGGVILLSLIASPLYDAKGTVIGAIESMRDITRLKETEEELARLNADLETIVRDRTRALEDEVAVRKRAEATIQASLNEKVLLLREIHHRVKNNLQIIISLTNLQMRTLNDPRLKQIMAETQNRVRAMSLVHEKLYQSENISSINLSEYTRFLANQLFSFYGIDHGKVSLQIAIEDIQLDINAAIPLGLILNELISNALKHAFPGGRRGTIRISGTSVNGVLTLQVGDDGIGLPPALDWRNAESLGLRLVNSLADQLGGTIEPGTGNGTAFIVTVPEKRSEIRP
jgi:PAS domain S-box-containing protein